MQTHELARLNCPRTAAAASALSVFLHIDFFGLIIGVTDGPTAAMIQCPDLKENRPKAKWTASFKKG